MEPQSQSRNHSFDWPEAVGISRLADAGRVLGISFKRRPTDDEMRQIHDFLRDPKAALAARSETQRSNGNLAAESSGLTSDGVSLGGAGTAKPRQYDDKNDVLSLIDKAHKHVCDIAAGRERWTMCIPARPERDSDLIIGAALSAARKAIESATPRALPGWKLVPIEPTDTMVEAGVKDSRPYISYVDAQDVYRVMLAAAPNADSSEGRTA